MVSWLVAHANQPSWPRGGDLAIHLNCLTGNPSATVTRGLLQEAPPTRWQIAHDDWSLDAQLLRVDEVEVGAQSVRPMWSALRDVSICTARSSGSRWVERPSTQCVNMKVVKLASHTVPTCAPASLRASRARG